MILVTYTQHNLSTNKKEMDYVNLKDLDAVVNWIWELGDKVMFKLIHNTVYLTQSGWKNLEVSTPNLIQVKNTSTNMYYTVQKVVSNEGILFEHIQHCSEQLIQPMALKRLEMKLK